MTCDFITRAVSENGEWQEDDQAKFGVHEAAQKMTPINLFMAGSIPFHNMTIGEEGFSAWWRCFWELFKNDRQKVGHEPGEPWTIEKLIEHAWKIQNQGINLKDVHVVGGVKALPVFTATPPSHFIAPILHMHIGQLCSRIASHSRRLL
jgi:hypothetical protein